MAKPDRVIDPVECWEYHLPPYKGKFTEVLTRIGQDIDADNGCLLSLTNTDGVLLAFVEKP